MEIVAYQVNELTWNNEGDLFFLTSGQGSIHILSYPDLKVQHVIQVGSCDAERLMLYR